MGDPRSVVQVKLACGHVNVYKAWDARVKKKGEGARGAYVGVIVPEEGSEIYCFRCMGITHRPYALEMDVDGKEIRGEWRWVCRTHGACGRGKHMAGESRVLVVRVASQHQKNHPEHETVIVDPDGVVQERWRPQRGGLWGDEEEIPF